MKNGWPDLRVTPSDAKAAIELLTAAAQRLTASTATTDEEIVALTGRVYEWRANAHDKLLQLFEPAAATPLQREIADNVLSTCGSQGDKLTAAGALLLDGTLYLSVLSGWLSAGAPQPWDDSPDQIMTNVRNGKYREQPQAAEPQLTPTSTSTGEADKVLKWFRRATAFIVHFCFWFWIANRAVVETAYHSILSHIPAIPGLSSFAVVGLVGIAWALWFSQFRLRWVFALPFYVALAPPALICGWVFGALLAPVFRWGQRILNPDGFQKETTRRRGLLQKLWLILLISWLVALRGVTFSWVYWIPVLLAVPVWLTTVRWALRVAIAPPSLTLAAMQLCQTKLDENTNNWRTKKPSELRTADSALRLWSMFGDALVRRYSGPMKLLNIQRESIAIFSLSLLGSFAASCAWFGLVGRALMLSSPDALSSYGFFTSGSLLEAALWSFGCMTTAISFPSAHASIFVKLLHGVILAAGLFQVTYLLACFSIVSAAQASRVGELGEIVSVQLQAKLTMAKALREVYKRQTEAS